MHPDRWRADGMARPNSVLTDIHHSHIHSISIATMTTCQEARRGQNKSILQLPNLAFHLITLAQITKGRADIMPNHLYKKPLSHHCMPSPVAVNGLFD